MQIYYKEIILQNFTIIIFVGKNLTPIRKAVLILLMCVCTVAAQAQLKKKRIGSTSKQHITLSIGGNHPVMDINTEHGASAQISYTYFFLKELGLKGFADYNYFWGKSTHYQSHFVSLGAEVVYNCFTNIGGRRENTSGSAIPERVYLHGGVGVSGFFCSPQPQYADGVTALFPVGFGITWAIADSWDLGFDGTYNFTISDRIDNTPSGKMTDTYPAVFITLAYKIPDARRSGTGAGYKSVRRKKCDPRKGCAITYE